MLRIAWRGVRQNAGRYVATIVAIVTGIAFFSSAGFLSDRVIDALEGDVDRQFGNVDVAIVPKEVEGAGASNAAGDLRIGASAADTMLTAPGVEAGAGVLTGSVAFLAPDGTTFANDAVGRLWVEDTKLNPSRIEAGGAPAAAGEIAVDRGTAIERGMRVGDRTTILTLAGEFDTTVVGITSFGSSDAIDRGGTVSLPAATAFDWLNSGLVEYQELLLRGPPEPTQLRAAVEPFAPDGFEVLTGDEFRQDKRDEIGSFGRVLKQGLQAFALLALFVGGFVIYNTFSVIVAQRLRELAILAAIGATPKQIRRSLRYEGLVIGAIGSGLGVVVGFLFSFGLMVLLTALGVDLPGRGVKVQSSGVIQALVAGTLVTVVSVTVPARRASRAEPIDALRQSAAPAARFSLRRTAAAAALISLGLFGLLRGGAAAVGFGALALLVGVIAAGPFIAAMGAHLMTPMLSRFGIEGRLAADNVARNPQRTATTANALLIGVFLVTLVTLAGTSVKDFVVGQIDDLSSADYTIESTGGTIDDRLIADLEATDGVQKVVPFRHESVTLDGRPSAVSTGDLAALTDVGDIEVLRGSLDDLGPGTIAVADDGAVVRSVGDTVTLLDSAGDRVELAVVAVMKGSVDTLSIGNVVDTGTFESFVGDTAPTMAFLDVASGAQTGTEDAIKARTGLRPDITLTSGDALGRLIGSVFEFLINAVNGLLLMSVVVALIGIVNTLSLSILERRRELGLLRVVGMVDRHVHRMVRLESLLISFLGTLTGVATGTVMGYALVDAIDRLTEADIAVSVPWLYLFGVLLAGVALGALAALLPARRSTRLDVLDAIAAG